MKPNFLLIALLFACPVTYAQQVRIEMGTVMNAAGQPVSDGMMVYGAESLKKNITYADVKGSPFLDDFRWARMYDANKNLLGVAQAKINFYTSYVHYLNMANAELAIGPDVVRHIEFFNPENKTEVTDAYTSLIDDVNQKLNKPFFVRVFNDGNIKLLKLQQKSIGTYDSLMGNFKRYMFTTRTEYYLQRQQTIEALRKLSKERVHAFMRSERDVEAFVKANNIDYRKEEDLVKLIDYYNKQNQ